RRNYYGAGQDAPVMRLAPLRGARWRPGAPLAASEAAAREAAAASALRAAHGAPPGADGPLVLAIETSCDETGVGVVRGRQLLANVIASSMDEHARYGGVVPEVAARAHLEALTPTLRAALAEARIDLADVDAVAVTSGPGLSGAL